MTGIITPNGILVRQGDSFDITMQFKRKNGQPHNISGSIINLNIKDEEGAVDMVIAGDIVDALQGRAIIKITPQHSNINIGSYNANIKIVFANGDVHTIFPQDLSRNAVFQITEGV